MATSVYTGPRTFTEIDQYRIDNQFGQPEQVSVTYLGLSVDYAAWVPAMGSAHPTFPLCFLKSISQGDSAGGLIQVTLGYVGTEISTLKTGSGLLYSNLQTSTQLVTKSFSWEGPAIYTAVLKKVSFSAQYTTIEATFNYTAYNYPNSGQFSGNAGVLVALVQANWVLNSAPIDAGAYSGYPTIPGTINPSLVLSRFTSKQLASSTYSGHAASGSVASSRGPWDVSETWVLDYNLGTVGIPTATYTF